jgi:hypothetical protein
VSLLQNSPNRNPAPNPNPNPAIAPNRAKRLEAAAKQLVPSIVLVFESLRSLFDITKTPWQRPYPLLWLRLFCLARVFVPSLCSAIPKNSAFLAKFHPLFVSFCEMLLVAALPRCGFAPLAFALKSSKSFFVLASRIVLFFSQDF